MVREAEGTTEGITFDNLNKNKWETALELGLTPTSLGGMGEGYYRLTTYFTDSIGEAEHSQPEGWAVSLSADQDIGEKVGAVFRYSWASEDYRAFKQRVAVGVQIKQPFNYKYDRIGLGAWWGDPTGDGYDAEYGMEMYWKFQLAPYLEVTPDFQFILNPQIDQERDAVAVVGLRLRIEL